MKTDCGSIHKPDYTKACCIKFLVEMSEISQNCHLYYKFANLFLTHINHSNKNNLLNFENFKIDILCGFLNALTKIISHYYYLRKFEYAKTMAKVAIKACMESTYREHPEVKNKYCAILINVSSIYERSGLYNNALKHIKLCLKYIFNPIDKAIVYNNMTRLYYCNNDYSSALKANKMCMDNVLLETNNILKERFANPNYISYFENKNKAELISFLFYNNGYLLEKLKFEEESIITYQKGLQFSSGTLGDLNILTNKFRPKLINLKVGKSIALNEMRRRSFDSRYDSDADYMSIFDGNFNSGILPKLKFAKKNNTNSKNISLTPMSKRKRENSTDSLMNQTFLQRGDSNINLGRIYKDNTDVKDLKVKMDYLIKKFEKFENLRESEEISKSKNSKVNMNEIIIKNDENLNKTIEKAESLSNTLNNTLIAQYEELNQKKKSKESIFSVKNIARTLKPTIKKIIESLTNHKNKMIRGRTNTSIRSNDSSLLREKYLNDLINEFEEDKSRSVSRGSSRSASKRNTLNVPNHNESIVMNKGGNAFENLSKMNSSNNTNIDKKTNPNHSNENNNNNSVKNQNLSNPSGDKKRTLKDMFSKAFNFNSNSNPNKKDVSQSKLAKLISEADEPDNTPTNSKRTVNQNYISNKNPNSKNINEIMSKIDNERGHHSEISIKNAKLNNSSFIDLNDDDNFDEKANNKLEFKDVVKTEMKKFTFNVIKDETGDEYEFKTYFLVNENVEKKQEVNNVENNGISLSSIIANHKNETNKKKNLNESRDSKNSNNSKSNNRFLNMFKEGMKKDIIKFDIKIDLDHTLDYNFKPYYMPSDSNKNSKENLDIGKSTHKKYTESISKLLLDANDNSNYDSKYDFNFKKKPEFSTKKFLENLILRFRYSSKSFTILREVEKKLYKINLSYTKPTEEKKGIHLKLYEEGNGLNILTENIIPFTKLINLMEKLCLSNALPQIIDIHLINSFDLFIEKVFIYFCYIIKKGENMILGVLPRPTGISSNKSYQFSFLKTNCLIDILILNKRETKFYIYNTDNDKVSFCFDWVLDHSSFSCLFSEISHINFERIDNEVMIKSYKIKDDKHLQKNNFIPVILLKIQEILKLKLDDQEIKIEKIHHFFKNAVIKMNLKNNLSFVDLFMSNSIEKVKNDNNDTNLIENKTNNISHLAFDYYILKKPDNNNTYYNKSFNLDDKYIQHILGTNYNFLNSYLLSNQFIPINYIVNNALVLEKNTQSQKEDYDLFIRQPVNLMNYKIQIEIKKEKYTVDFNYIFYCKFCSFYKLTCVQNSNNKTFCVIMPGFEMYNWRISSTDYEKYIDEEIQKILWEAMPINNESFEDVSRREILTEILTNYLTKIVTNDAPYSIFDNIYNVFHTALKY